MDDELLVHENAHVGLDRHTVEVWLVHENAHVGLDRHTVEVWLVHENAHMGLDTLWRCGWYTRMHTWDSTLWRCGRGWCTTTCAFSCTSHTSTVCRVPRVHSHAPATPPQCVESDSWRCGWCITQCVESHVCILMHRPLGGTV